MSQKIKSHILKVVPGKKGNDLIELILQELESAIAKEIEKADAVCADNLRHIAALLETVKKKEKKTMVAQADLDASLQALSDAVNNAIANIPPGTPASTPDTAVLAFKQGVDTNVAALNAAEAAAKNPPPTP